MLTELYKAVPREFKSTLSGVRGYAESCLDFHSSRMDILCQPGLSRPERRSRILKAYRPVEELTVILFTYALFLKFIHGDETIKGSVEAFESLGIEAVSIGSMELSRSSRYYSMGHELAMCLMGTLKDVQLEKLFAERVQFNNIATWYKQRNRVEL